MPSLVNRPSSRKKHLLSLTIICLWLILLVWAALNQQNIIDWWQLLGYHPDQSISALASSDTMTPLARKIFYVNKPSIEDKATFNNNCPNNGGEQTIVLGCYHPGQKGIYLLSVSDPRLAGVEQVTAAHEMLHAAYERLSSSERNKVDGWLLDYYHHDLKDPRLLATMAAYQKTEPGSVVNEMNSVFGTEVANLPAPLEQYYSRYFTNRHKITDYAAAYQSQFTTLQNSLNSDDSQLAAWLDQINSLKTDLSNKLTQINSAKSQLDSSKASGNIAAYNSQVAPYNQLVNTYNAEASQLQSLIDQYNTLVASRNNIALSEKQLYTELNGNTPIINK